MATVKLGPVGDIITLPKVQWTEGPPDFSTSTVKQIEEKRMSDGSLRFGFWGRKREWPLFWGFLTLEQLDILRDLHALNQTMKFQNNWEDATWYDVVIFFFDHGAAGGSRSIERYWCEMTLREA